MSQTLSLTFKQEIPYERRKNLSKAIIQKYPDRIPIIVEQSTNKDPIILRRKFLAPNDFTMGSLFYEIKKQICELSPTASIKLLW